MRRVLLLALAGAALSSCTDDFADKMKADFRRSPAWQPAANTISLNQELNNALGSPVEFGDLKLVSVEQESHEVTADIQLSGPKGKGHAVVRVAQPDPKKPWLSKGGDFFPAAGPPIHLQPR